MKVAGGKGSPGVPPNQSVKPPSLSTPLEKSQADEMKNLQQDVKELISTVNRLLREIEKSETNAQKVKNTETSVESKKSSSRRINKSKRIPLHMYSPMNEDEPEIHRFFYHIEFETEKARRETNPYELKKRLQEESVSKVVNLTPDSRNGFSCEFGTREVGEKYKQITFIEENKCAITFHRFRNQSKGIIYIEQFEFSNGLKKNLIEEYLEIQDAEVATFIKPRYEGTTPLLVTSKRMKPPYFFLHTR